MAWFMLQLAQMNSERQRLAESRMMGSAWRRWGPYLSERQWGTVREDYSEHGNAWENFPHDQARRRAYRWGEDGLMGWCDHGGRLCFAPALWNGRDSILKERLFGLGGPEGNHGEDVKECYYYLDSTPTHSYAKSLYKYPQREYPYAKLREANQSSGRGGPEIELDDLGVFDDDRYFDVEMEYAKHGPEDLLWRIRLTNRAAVAAPIHVLPMVWFRNTWSWGATREKPGRKPEIRFQSPGLLRVEHEKLGEYFFHVDGPGLASGPKFLFTENETNHIEVFGTPNPQPYVKDAFHHHVIHGRRNVCNPDGVGTKAAAHLQFTLQPGASVEIRMRMRPAMSGHEVGAFDGFEDVMALRRGEAEAFYAEILPEDLDAEKTRIMRQSYAGLLWSKQYYKYAVDEWLAGDPGMPPPPANREQGRNSDWMHFHAEDVLSMPDKWEYPWFAAWDTAFHMLPFATLDPDFAKHQLLLLLREWYMHPNGQLPAYEWNFSDVNPPVHAWAVWRVYKIADSKGGRDIRFLESAFHKLLINFTWWVNCKDTDGRHVFGGGFLGLDNIGVFDRSHALPGGGRLHQADGTAWMASYCLTMLSIALELATHNPSYEDIASKFFEHYVNITDAINSLGGSGLWNDEDGFYYDQLIIDHQPPIPLRIRSLVGLLPMCAVTVLKQKTIDALPNFRKRVDWLLVNRPDLLKYVTIRREDSDEKSPGRCLLAIPDKERLRRCLGYLLDPNEFLSEFGIRSLSKAHGDAPFVFDHAGMRNSVAYTPGESDTDMFGGNSNWRGPIWFPVNYLIVEALERYHYHYGNSFKIEYPTGSGNEHTLGEIADDLGRRLTRIFLPDDQGNRPCFGDDTRHSADPNWNGLLLFHEYFHGETGKGLGASHQTGWTSLVVKIIRERQNKRAKNPES